MTRPDRAKPFFSPRDWRWLANWRRVGPFIVWLVWAVMPTPQDLTEAGVYLGEARD